MAYRYFHVTGFVCSECGSNVDDDAIICTYCGAIFKIYGQNE